MHRLAKVIKRLAQMEEKFPLIFKKVFCKSLSNKKFVKYVNICMYGNVGAFQERKKY